MNQAETIRQAAIIRADSPEFQRRLLARVIDMQSLARIKQINQIVGRAGNILNHKSAALGRSHWSYAPEVPDYQKYLSEYVMLKRMLGLHRRTMLTGATTDAEVIWIGRRIGELEMAVRDARAVARRLRFGEFSARALQETR